MNSFGYVPDYRDKSALKDGYLKIFGYPYPPRRNEAVLVFKFLSPRGREKILEIGCGDGVWYLELKKRGLDVVGIDLSDHDLSKLRERARSLNLKPEIIKADAQKLPFNKSTFDKIYSISTFEHIENDKEAFGEANRILKPGGLLVISVPMKETPLFTKLAVKLPRPVKNLFCNKLVQNAKNEEDYLNNFNKYYFHYRNYTIEDIEERIERYGFEMEDRSYNCRYFGSFIWSMYHTLKLFERHKSPTTDYEFRSETAFALTAPFFYLLLLIDRLLFWTRGRIIVLKLRKKQ